MADYKIGLHGGALVILPKPHTDAPALTYIGGSQTSGQGATTMDIAGRKWGTTLTWVALGDDDYTDVAQWAIGTQGNGPFDLVLPALGPTTRLMNITAFDPAPLTLGLWSPTLTLLDVAPF